MRTTFIFLFVVTVLASCSAPSAPEFKTVKNLRVTDKSGTVYTVRADAVYTNPNSMGGDLNGMEMDITVDDVKVTHLSQEKKCRDSARNRLCRSYCV